jgi:hypothetical protein
VQDTWIHDLCNPETFYSNVTAITLFDHLHKHFGGLHTLDMYYKGTPDIPKYIFLLEDVQRKAARACLPITNRTLTVLASTALLAADTFLHTTELWEELDPASKTWAAWKTAYLAVHKKRANRLRVTGGADNLGQANTAHATTLNPGLLDSIDNTLGNLASAATNKKAVLEQLIASNSSLATSNFTLTNQLKTLHDQLAAMSRGGGGRGGSSNDPKRRRGPDPVGYCWSHRYRVGHGHTGHCSNPQEGQQPTATHNNITGGSIANKDWTPNRTT